MGKTYTPKYRLILDGVMMLWKGKPTLNNLENFIKGYTTSLEAGGANEHISRALGYIPYPKEARVETNTSKPEVQALWKAGMFQTFK